VKWCLWSHSEPLYSAAYSKSPLPITCCFLHWIVYFMNYLYQKDERALPIISSVILLPFSNLSYF
jgi:hypothetical protein